MENFRRKSLKLVTVLIVAILFSSTAALLLNPATTATVSAQTSNNNLLQYTWPQLGGSGGWTLSSSGPAPNHPTVAWTQSCSGLSSVSGGFAGTVTAFDGMVFVATTNYVTAFNGLTAQWCGTTRPLGQTSKLHPHKSTAPTCSLTAGQVQVG